MSHPPTLRAAVTLPSPAKLNLFLEVTGRRADGYHLLDTLMVPVDLGETVTIGEVGRPGAIALWCSEPSIPVDRRNTCWRAVDLMRRAIGIDRGIGVAIHKTIPDAAGLGGGSDNAAVVITEINRRFGSRLSPDDLNTIAAQVGADVPYFLNPVPTRCTGIGEIRAEVEPDSETIAFSGVLVVPGHGASTPAVFKALAASGPISEPRKFAMDAWSQTLYKGRTTGDPNTSRELGALLFNRLRPVAEALVPEISSVRMALLAAGAVAVEMTGSGSGVFAVCESEAAAGAVLDGFRSGYRAPVRLARTIAFPGPARP
jgi:4-diphosphocytidyl-2C-methyl-D-erythritol kinase